ncbi:MAG: hypothetical protein KA362_19510, partial [Chloroflexi bacterium]|nr:hypothetical protein [Chloroflexota bacterium]
LDLRLAVLGLVENQLRLWFSIHCASFWRGWFFSTNILAEMAGVSKPISINDSSLSEIMNGAKNIDTFRPSAVSLHHTTPSCPNNLLTQRLWGNFVTMSLAGQTMLSSFLNESFLNEVRLTQSG